MNKKFELFLRRAQRLAAIQHSYNECKIKKARQQLKQPIEDQVFDDSKEFKV